jgi:hypothetical protein
VTTGTSNPPYSVFAEKDSANSSVTLQYQSITCMPQYRGNSFEELRMQDYQQNRKTAGSNAFGQSAFGGTTQPSAAPSLFGQPQPQPAQPQPANPIFGSFGNTAANNANTGTGNAFSGLGQNPAQPTGGFGTFNQTSQQPAASGFGAFGQPQQQPQQQQPPQQPPQQQQGASLFGSTGAFGSQNKPAGGFGTGGFGGAPNTGSTGLFGQTNTAQQPAAPTSLFGQSQPANNTFGGGAFGANTAAQKPSIFGQTTQQQPPAGGSFGLFGSQQQQQQQQQQQNPQGQQGNTGAFGNQPAFGQTNAAQPQQGGCKLTFTAYSYGIVYNTKQYLALLRLNSLLRDCLVAREVVCSEMRSSRVLSSKANHLHLVSSETRQQHLHQVGADSSVIIPLARRQVHPNNPVFSAIPLDSQLLSPRTMPLGEVLPSSVAHRHLLPVSPLLPNPSGALRWVIL